STSSTPKSMASSGCKLEEGANQRDGKTAPGRIGSIELISAILLPVQTPQIFHSRLHEAVIMGHIEHASGTTLLPAGTLRIYLRLLSGTLYRLIAGSDITCGELPPGRHAS